MTVRDKDELRRLSKFRGGEPVRGYRAAFGGRLQTTSRGQGKFLAGTPPRGSAFKIRALNAGKLSQAFRAPSAGRGATAQDKDRKFGYPSGGYLPRFVSPAMPRTAMARTFADAVSIYALVNELQHEPVTKRTSRPDAVMYAASEALRRAAIEPALDATALAASMLHKAAQETVDRQPRHAAVALSAWDALRCTDDPFETLERRRVLWEAAEMLLSQMISTEAEMALLDRMDEAGLERVPPFEDTLVGELVNSQLDEQLR